MTTTSADPIGQKMSSLFEATDTNHDGYIEWADYQLLIDRYISGYRMDRNDRRAQALTVAYMMLWQELLRHGNGEHRLDKGQFVNAIRAASIDTSRFNMVEAMPHAVFDIIDADGVNTISKDEFAQLLKVLDFATPDAMDRFMILDTDGDGQVSRQEFIRSVREFLYSGDLSAPGGVIFGIA
ncbi:EF-hand domain-containing protein [Microtetraspora sp. NBRC 16547]|uniref:EF-hand domain-containing protein n=1 Tax=Microtetraspora sp. NBRC 16547 TaxID=3030993 RepID=UPI0024A17771|nr:EF-hand domain-containing protein [Microtetraspora sp. NBRC 16547]GLW99414.1 hypothetical protein Misp02_35010 [Microtetraspora sp. NBRC 16547]